MKKLILIVPIILLYCLGCDYATNYDVVLKGNSRHQDNGSVNQVEINNALQIIEETVEFYKLAQRRQSQKMLHILSLLRYIGKQALSWFQVI